MTTPTRWRPSTLGLWCRESWSAAASKARTTGARSSRIRRCPPHVASCCRRTLSSARRTMPRRLDACRSSCSSSTTSRCCWAASASASPSCSSSAWSSPAACREPSARTMKPFKVPKSFVFRALMLTISQNADWKSSLLLHHRASSHFYHFTVEIYFRKSFFLLVLSFYSFR